MLVSVVNICITSPFYSVSLNNSSELKYDYTYESYKYKTLEVYAIHSDDLSKKHKLALYDLHEIHLDNFDIFDLSSVYWKRKGVLTLIIDLDDRCETFICVSKDRIRSGFCSGNIFGIDLTDYEIKSYIRENGESTSILRIESK